MYKKNLSSYQHKTSTKSLKTRITFTTTVKGEGEKAPDRTFTVTIDSPLINKYSQIYEDVIEVNDQDVKDEASLRKYGEQYYRTSLCDMMEDSLEIEVVGQSDVPVQMFDVVSIFHERYNLDVRKKITKYTYSPMAKKLKSIGFGQFQSGLANAIGNAVSDAVKGEAQQLHDDFERQLARELKNADLAFDRKTEELQNEFTDGLNAAKAKAEEVGAKIHEEMEKERPEFVKKIREEILNGVDSITEISKKLERVSETARVNAGLIGGDGTAQYNKNRLSGGTAKKIAYGTDFVEVGHNGNGFEVGKKYVISWSATCTPYGKTDVTVVVNKTPFYGGHVHLAPANSVMPTIEKDLTQKEEQVLAVYYGDYRLTFSGDWYQNIERSVTIDNQTSQIELTPVYKTFADGQNSRYDGSWSENPTFIFDGGRK